jgi:hypothetical protein
MTADEQREALEQQVANNPDDLVVQKQLHTLLESGNCTFEGVTLNEWFAKTGPPIDRLDNYPFDTRGDLHVFARMGTFALPFLFRHFGSSWLVESWQAGSALAEFSSDVTCSQTIADKLVLWLTHSHGLIRLHARWVLAALAPHSSDIVFRYLQNQPTLQPRLADALAYHGRHAQHLVPELLKLQASLPVFDHPSIGKILQEIRGPWPCDPENPVPYLGEHISFYSDGPTGTSREDFQMFVKEVWQEAASGFVRYLDESEGDPLFLEGWNDHLESKCQDALGTWWPERVVIARPSLILSMYKEETRNAIHASVESYDQEVFTMGELLFKLHRCHNKYANANDRIFEGLTLEEPGRYYITTGSLV